MCLVVGVKFCGNCNPQIDSAAVLSKLKTLLPGYRFVSHSSDKDVLLIIAGCQVNCTTDTEFTGPRLLIAGATLELHYYPEDRLAEEVAQRLKLFTTSG